MKFTKYGMVPVANDDIGSSSTYYCDTIAHDSTSICTAFIPQFSCASGNHELNRTTLGIFCIELTTPLDHEYNSEKFSGTRLSCKPLLS